MLFTKDIFISYAHIDDEALAPDEPGWVSEFHRSLEIRLSQLLGYKPVIWRDKRLDGNHRFSDEIVQQLNEIALLVSVFSPRYIKSEWCQREIAEFYRVSENNIGVFLGNKSRIFKVIKTPVSLDLQPEIIKGLLGYDFFKTDQDTGRSVEFGNLYGKEYQLAFWAKLNDLCHDIAALLTRIRDEENQPHPAANKTNPQQAVNGTNKIRVFLAETSSDIAASRDTILRVLGDKGYEVLPDKNLPLVCGEYESEIKSAIQSCDLCIHMLGKNFGLVPEETHKSKIQIQNEIAAALSSEKQIPRLIWMPPGINIEDERQAGYINELKHSDKLLAGADLLIGPLDDLKFAISDKLEKLAAGTTNLKRVNVSENETKKIYLICDQNDLESIRPIENGLFDRGYEVTIPVFEGEQAELRLDHQENLLSCDAVIIYYGAGNELWLRSKTRDLLKMAGYGRTKPIKVKSVLIAGPFTTQKERFRSNELKIISLKDDVAAALQQFFNDLEA